MLNKCCKIPQIKDCTTWFDT